MDCLVVTVVVILVVLVYELTLPGKTFGGRHEEHIILFVFIFIFLNLFLLTLMRLHNSCKIQAIFFCSITVNYIDMIGKNNKVQQNKLKHEQLLV